MGRKRKLVVVLAVIGWTGTLLSHVIALRVDERERKEGWNERRNQFWLLSSLATNTLVLTTVYRHGRRIRKRRRRT